MPKVKNARKSVQRLSKTNVDGANTGGCSNQDRRRTEYTYDPPMLYKPSRVIITRIPLLFSPWYRITQLTIVPRSTERKRLRQGHSNDGVNLFQRRRRPWNVGGEISWRNPYVHTKRLTLGGRRHELVDGTTTYNCPTTENM